MIEKIEGLNSELQLRALSKDFLSLERKRPVLVERKVHVFNSGAGALARTRIGIAADREAIPGVGCWVQPLLRATNLARLGEDHVRPCAELARIGNAPR